MSLELGIQSRNELIGEIID
jgi:hypothetical protein